VVTVRENPLDSVNKLSKKKSGYRGDATHIGLTGHIFMHVQRIIHLSEKKHRFCKSVSDF
jgi:hypothetical protein